MPAHVEPVARLHRDFRTCTVCERIYWEGSHTRRLGAVLDAALASVTR